MMKRRIEVVAHDPCWPARFKNEARKLACVFQDNLLDIHHIGSTAVPGLAAKPTIDILCEVKAGTHVTDYYEDMRQLGYECRGECLDAVIPGTPGRFYFPKIVDAQHIFHVHVCHGGNAEVPVLIGLRDYLRTHSEDAGVYGAHKARLAETFVHNNLAYMNGKDVLVKDLVKRAMEWKAEQT